MRPLFLTWCSASRARGRPSVGGWLAFRASPCLPPCPVSLVARAGPAGSRGFSRFGPVRSWLVPVLPVPAVSRGSVCSRPCAVPVLPVPAVRFPLVGLARSNLQAPGFCPARFGSSTCLLQPTSSTSSPSSPFQAPPSSMGCACCSWSGLSYAVLQALPLGAAYDSFSVTMPYRLARGVIGGSSPGSTVLQCLTAWHGAATGPGRRAAMPYRLARCASAA